MRDRQRERERERDGSESERRTGVRCPGGGQRRAADRLGTRLLGSAATLSGPWANREIKRVRKEKSDREREGRGKILREREREEQVGHGKCERD